MRPSREVGLEYITAISSDFESVRDDLQSLREELAHVRANADLAQSLRRELHDMKADFAGRFKEMESLINERLQARASTTPGGSGVCQDNVMNGTGGNSSNPKIFDISDKEPDPWVQSADPWSAKAPVRGDDPPPFTQLPANKPGPPVGGPPIKAAPCTKSAPPSGIGSSKAEPKAPPAKGPPAGMPTVKAPPSVSLINEVPGDGAPLSPDGGARVSRETAPAVVQSEAQAAQRPQAKAPPANFSPQQQRQGAAIGKLPPAGMQMPQAKPLPKGPPAGLSSTPSAMAEAAAKHPPPAKGPPAHLLEHLPPAASGRVKAPPAAEASKPASKAPPAMGEGYVVKVAPVASMIPVEGAPPAVGPPPRELQEANPAVTHTDVQRLPATEQQQRPAVATS